MNYNSGSKQTSLISENYTSAVVKLNETSVIVQGNPQQINNLQQASENVHKNQLQAFRDENQKLQQTIDLLMEELKQLKTKVSYSELTIEQLNQKIKQDERIKTITQQGLEDQQTLHMQIIQQQSQECSELKQQISQTEQKLIDYEIENKQLQEHIQISDAQQKDLQNIIILANEKINQLKEQIQQQNNLIEQFKTKTNMYEQNAVYNRIQSIQNQNSPSTYQKQFFVPWWITAIVGAILTSLVIVLGTA